MNDSSLDSSTATCDLRLVTCLRGWIVADGVTVPALAVGNNVQISDDRIRLTFVGGGAELYAIACGKKYQIEQQQEVHTAADVTFRSQTAIIKSSNQYCKVLASNAQNEAVAFYRNSSGSPVSVKIVDEITDSNQIAIADGGEVRASSNLVGKTVKILRLKAVYPEAVIISTEDITGYRVFSLIQTEQRTIELHQYNDCSLERASTAQRVDSKTRTLEFTYNPENKVVCQV